VIPLRAGNSAGLGWLGVAEEARQHLRDTPEVPIRAVELEQRQERGGIVAVARAGKEIYEGSNSTSNRSIPRSTDPSIVMSTQ
jgi:hypothetical protein